MPRSASPHAYPTVYYSMLEAFSKSQMPFHSQCDTSSEAYNKRNEWHSFIRALEKSNTEINLARAKIARGRSCVVTGPNEDIILWKSRDLEPYVDKLEAALLDFTDEIDSLDDLLPQQIAPTVQEMVASDLESTLSDFMIEPELDPHAQQLFEDFMSEADTIIESQLNEDQLLSLADLPVRHISTHNQFSSEEEDTTNIE